MKYHFDDGRTNDHKNWRKRVLWLTLELFIANQINNFWKNNQAASDKQKITQQIGYLTNQLSIVNSNQATLQQQNQRLLSELATNSSITPDIRERIIQSKIQFEAINSQAENINEWLSHVRDRRLLLQIQREKKHEQKRTEITKLAHRQYEVSLPCYNYAVNTLAKFLDQAATLNGDIAVSNFRGLPTEIDVDEKEIKIAEIKFQTNVNWNFDIYLGERQDDGRRMLTIKSKIGYIDMLPTPSGDIFTTVIHISNEEELSDDQPIAKYKSSISEAIQYYIATQIEKSGLTNQLTNP